MILFVCVQPSRISGRKISSCIRIFPCCMSFLQIDTPNTTSQCWTTSRDGQTKPSKTKINWDWETSSSALRSQWKQTQTRIHVEKWSWRIEKENRTADATETNQEQRNSTNLESPTPVKNLSERKPPQPAATPYNAITLQHLHVCQDIQKHGKTRKQKTCKKSRNLCNKNLLFSTHVTFRSEWMGRKVLVSLDKFQPRSRMLRWLGLLPAHVPGSEIPWKSVKLLNQQSITIWSCS